MLSKVVFLDKKVLNKFSTSSLQVLSKFSTRTHTFRHKTCTEIPDFCARQPCSKFWALKEIFNWKGEVKDIELERERERERDWTVWLRPTPKKPPRAGKGMCRPTNRLHLMVERRKRKWRRKEKKPKINEDREKLLVVHVAFETSMVRKQCSTPTIPYQST